MISVRAADFAWAPAPRRPKPPLAALPLMPAERKALERFAALETGSDHDAYLAACKAACRAGPAAFNILCDVALRRLPPRSPSGIDLLQDAAHELTEFFAALDRQLAA